MDGEAVNGLRCAAGWPMVAAAEDGGGGGGIGGGWWTPIVEIMWQPESGLIRECIKIAVFCP